MTKVVPAILVQSENEYLEKISNLEVRNEVSVMQFDILDGSMFGASSWSDIEVIKNLGNTPNFELHLMIENPLQTVEKWHSKIKTVKRAIIHAEIKAGISESISAIKKLGIEVGLAINPETEISAVKMYLDDIDMILIMGVHPGQSGQKYLGSAINKKIREVHEKFSDLPVAVDGGITLLNAESIVDAGASELCVASTIWQAEDKKKVIQSLSSF
ncbi:hypothetical protein COY25_01330 [Candidatus Uhrbacteria bacterium CG_4_10_14_0_2_um_filter_41_7]|uniref:Ribulose-phosphate 3-epimerase n=1 Tax=Candidatus Uhrbacteria bacterium CG_4_9_14_3_um_filter_41_35 TaxID=1975034 RepID=A0A2M7XGJ3_9BACT|nr:MAG: hypothetical protein COV92_03330 [Candidatus Uhrbacteria bacterium CG11_big_fil_rev_8_21_14_0_20_41_9]PIZ55058.1 MAG: hypothetical protein COY25_01330 [Candidatus Uhrbacteria bacterium CG_4_10_14_0_2_um_filter_41_7]PJA46997.1 MAG: hypothetical protein CO173_00525 [Candidatus Uhrbacteria bacterium CG_4_9_14_3_um_filter_41_35]